MSLVSCEIKFSPFQWTLSYSRFIFYDFSIFLEFHFFSVTTVTDAAFKIACYIFTGDDDVSMVAARSIVTFIKLEQLAITETEYLRSDSRSWRDASTRKTFFIVFHAYSLTLYVFSLLFNFSQTSQMISFVFDSAVSVRENERKTPFEREREKYRVGKTLHMKSFSQFPRLVCLHFLSLSSLTRLLLTFHSHITHVENKNYNEENVQLFEIQQLKSHSFEGSIHCFFQWEIFLVYRDS